MLLLTVSFAVAQNKIQERLENAGALIRDHHITEEHLADAIELLMAARDRLPR